MLLDIQYFYFYITHLVYYHLVIVFQVGDVSWVRCLSHQQAGAGEGHGHTCQKPGQQSKLHGVH